MSNQPKTFTFINNEKLCDIVESARNHIIYAAPSISEAVAKSLCDFKEKNSDAALRVIIDADAEAFRLGFGEPAGLVLLTEKQIDVRRAEGLRIGVFVADEDAWVYSPTPEIIFTQPTFDINNAIQVSVLFAEQILLSVAPDVRVTPEEDILNESFIAADLTPEIGSIKLESRDIEKIEKDLKENPPQKFDAARKVRVYQGYFQFVELHLTGCQLTRHTINIPKSLLNIAEDNDFRNRIKSTCRLVDDTGDFSRKIKDIESQVADVRKHFTRPLGKNYGVVILRKVRNEFEAEIEKIRGDLKKLSEEVKESLQKEIDNSHSNLIKMLLPNVVSNPPKKLTAQLWEEVTEDNAQRFIEKEIAREIPTTDKLIGEMKLEYYYKDVTFESLNDENFIKAIEEKYPYNNFAKLYSEEETMGKKIPSETNRL